MGLVAARAWVSLTGVVAFIAIMLIGVKAEETNDMTEQLIGDMQEAGLTDEMAFHHHLLHRFRREVSWDAVEKFYDDKNNFAMYLVLPVIVLVYGGCAVIYCVARCRRYMKKKKKKAKDADKSLVDNEPEDNTTTDPPVRGQPSIVPKRINPQKNSNGISSNPNPGSATQREVHSSSEVRISMEQQEQSETPLPWQVPGDKEPLYASKAAAATDISARKPNTFTNKSYTPDTPSTKQPPAYEQTYEKQPAFDRNTRPMSKPPPYEENITVNDNKYRRGSVEEIIALDPKPVNVPIHELNERKRRRPGSRSGRSDNQQLEDLERDKARQLVRGDRPRRDPPVDQAAENRDKTPDIISHARTRPLEPSYKPTVHQPQADPSLMARQAAQLLRLDHIGKQAGKKSKRLVFVTD